MHPLTIFTYVYLKFIVNVLCKLTNKITKNTTLIPFKRMLCNKQILFCNKMRFNLINAKKSYMIGVPLVSSHPLLLQSP